MRIESAQAVMSASFGWLAAIGTSEQITGSLQLVIWLIFGAVCGGGTAVLFPSPKDYPVWRQFAAAVVAAIGSTVAGFQIFGIHATTDSVFAVAWGAGGIAWAAMPLLKKGGLDRIRSWLAGAGGKPNE